MAEDAQTSTHPYHAGVKRLANWILDLEHITTGGLLCLSIREASMQTFRQSGLHQILTSSVTLKVWLNFSTLIVSHLKIGTKCHRWCKWCCCKLQGTTCHQAPEPMWKAEDAARECTAKASVCPWEWDHVGASANGASPQNCIGGDDGWPVKFGLDIPLYNGYIPPMLGQTSNRLPSSHQCVQTLKIWINNTCRGNGSQANGFPSQNHQESISHWASRRCFRMAFGGVVLSTGGAHPGCPLLESSSRNQLSVHSAWLQKKHVCVLSRSSFLHILTTSRISQYIV